jgi:glycosyltransferase involved in cell wall biosynthesis
MKKIGLVTPIKDEIDNLEKLFDSVLKQKMKIDTWVFIENDSIDGTKKALREYQKTKYDINVVVKNRGNENKKYELGFKYSSLVRMGMDYLINHSDCNYIGILDADCFPEEDYYKILIAHFDKNEKLGIISGCIIYDNGQIDFNRNKPRGGCRLWKRECLLDAGYIISMSADSVSSVKAVSKGWEVMATKDTFVSSRDVGKRVNFEYYGKSAYYRGFSINYCAIKTFKYLCKGNFSKAYNYFRGYFKFYLKGEKKFRMKMF